MSHACSEDEWLKLLSERLGEARLRVETASTRIVYQHLALAAEYAVKAAIARRMRLDEWPAELQVHDLRTLADRGDLADAIKALGAKDSSFRANWAIVRGLTDRRYRMADVNRTFVRDILVALDDPKHGVVRCLAKI